MREKPFDVTPAGLTADGDQIRKTSVLIVVTVIPSLHLIGEEIRQMPVLEIGNPENERDARIFTRRDRKNDVDARVEKEIARVVPSVQCSADLSAHARQGTLRESKHALSREQRAYVRERIVVGRTLPPDVVQLDALVRRKRRDSPHEMVQIVATADPFLIRIDADQACA
jgi:hypothetical protein